MSTESLPAAPVTKSLAATPAAKSPLTDPVTRLSRATLVAKCVPTRFHLEVIVTGYDGSNGWFTVRGLDEFHNEFLSKYWARYRHLMNDEMSLDMMTAFVGHGEQPGDISAYFMLRKSTDDGSSQPQQVEGSALTERELEGVIRQSIQLLVRTLRILAYWQMPQELPYAIDAIAVAFPGRNWQEVEKLEQTVKQICDEYTEAEELAQTVRARAKQKALLVTDADNEVQQIKQQIKDLRAKVAQQCDVIDEKQEVVKEAKQRLADAKRDAKKISRENSRLHRTKLKTAKARFVRVRSEGLVDEAEAEVQYSANALKEAERNAKQAQDDLNSLLRRQKELGRALKKARNNRASAQTHLDEARDEADNVENKAYEKLARVERANKRLKDAVTYAAIAQELANRMAAAEALEIGDLPCAVFGTSQVNHDLEAYGIDYGDILAEAEPLFEDLINTIQISWEVRWEVKPEEEDDSENSNDSDDTDD